MGRMRCPRVRSHPRAHRPPNGLSTAPNVTLPCKHSCKLHENLYDSYTQGYTCRNYHGHDINRVDEFMRNQTNIACYFVLAYPQNMKGISMHMLNKTSSHILPQKSSSRFRHIILFSKVPNFALQFSPNLLFGGGDLEVQCPALPPINSMPESHSSYQEKKRNTNASSAWSIRPAAPNIKRVRNATIVECLAYM